MLLNRIRETTSVALAMTGESGGIYANNRVLLEEGAGVVVDAAAAPAIEGLLVDGGEVGVAYTSTTGPR